MAETHVVLRDDNWVCVHPKCMMRELDVAETHQHTLMPVAWNFEVEKVGVIFNWSLSDDEGQMLCGTTIKDPTALLSEIVSDHQHSIDCMG